MSRKPAIRGKKDEVILKIREITYDTERREKSKNHMGKTFYHISRDDLDKRFSI